MFALRYAALVALVVWVGGLIVLLLAGADACDLARVGHRIALICGSVLLVTLFAMKFLGPPPYAFRIRALVAAVMLAIALGSTLDAAQSAITALRAFNAAAGLFLLAFYARE